MLLTSFVTSLIVHLMQTSSDFEQDIIDTVLNLWHDHLRSCGHAGGGHSKHIHWNEFSFLWFIRTFLYCQFNLTHLVAFYT